MCRNFKLIMYMFYLVKSMWIYVMLMLFFIFMFDMSFVFQLILKIEVQEEMDKWYFNIKFKEIVFKS